MKYRHRTNRSKNRFGTSNLKWSENHVSVAMELVKAKKSSDMIHLGGIYGDLADFVA